MSVERELQQIGAYKILNILGEGGMGVVYQGEHAETRQQVAIKTVRIANESHLLGIRREIRALMRLRHPSIVQIVGQGIEGGRPWYAMELLSGETLSTYIARIWGQEINATSRSTTLPELREITGEFTPEAPTLIKRSVSAGQLSRALALARRICLPLAFLHDNGIIHRDLKPSNIFLEQNQKPVLVDFGLARRVEGSMARAVLELYRGLEGTPTYMAPEQIQGEPIDARTDIYALGCVLYEMLTGRPPYIGASMQEVLHQHLTSRPTPPSSLVEGLPVAIEQLLEAMLARNPRDRVGHVLDVADALTTTGDEPLDPQNRRVPIYRPTLSGRYEALDTLAEALYQTNRGAGSFVVIGGQSGVGKTFLAIEAVRRAARDFQVITGVCSPSGAPLHPLAGFFSTLSDRCTALGREAVEMLIGPRLKTLAKIEPTLLSLPGAEQYPEPPALTGSAAIEYLLSCIRDTIAAMAEDQPLALVLDDLQWADELTLKLLSSLSKRWLSKLPIVIIGTYRSDEVSPLLRQTLQSDGISSIELSPIEPQFISSLIKDMLAVNAVPVEMSDFLAKQSKGNPIFVAEYLRAAVSEGLLRRSPQKTIELLHGDSSPEAFASLPLPSDFGELVSLRIKGLSDGAKHIASSLSVLGHEAEPELLLSLTDLPEAEHFDSLTELLTRQVFESSEQGSLRFVHDKLKENTYAQLSSEQRRGLHQKTAEVISSFYEGDPSHFTELALHWKAARIFDRALVALEQAGRYSLQFAAYEDARAHFQEALSLALQHPNILSTRQLALLKNRLGLVLLSLGETDQAEKFIREALRLLGKPLPSSQAGWGALLLKEIGRQSLHRFGFGVAPSRPEEELEDLREMAMAAETLSIRYFYVDKALEMMATAVFSVNLAEEAGSTKLVPRSYAALGVVVSLMKRSSLAEDYLDRGVRGARELNDPSAICATLLNTALYHSGNGRLAEGEKHCQEAHQLIYTIDDPRHQGMADSALGHAAFYQGRLEEALERYNHLRRSAISRNNNQYAIWGLFAAARSLLYLGRFDEALELLLEASRGLEKTPELQSEVICYGLLALTYLRLNQKDLARTTADKELACIKRSKPVGYPALDGYVACAETYLELWQESPTKKAPKELSQSLSALRSFANTLPVANPACLWLEGRLSAALGQTEKANATLRESAALAQTFGMPLNEAQALYHLSHLPLPAPIQEQYRGDAKKIFSRLGASYYSNLLSA